MPVLYREKEINELINEPKNLPEYWDEDIYVLNHMDIVGENGNKFRIYVRYYKECDTSFSVVFGVLHPLNNDFFCIRRYNGNNHIHYNRIENNEKISGFHIHIATERYQERNQEEESYAIETDRYTNVKEALECLIEDANFITPIKLFE